MAIIAPQTGRLIRMAHGWTGADTGVKLASVAPNRVNRTARRTSGRQRRRSFFTGSNGENGAGHGAFDPKTTKYAKRVASIFALLASYCANRAEFAEPAPPSSIVCRESLGDYSNLQPEAS